MDDSGGVRAPQRAASIPRPSATASATVSAPRRSRSASDSPSSSSMAMNSWPPSSPISYTWQTFGWLTPAAARASRRKRLRADSSGSAIVFTATRRPRLSSSAAKTTPIPPCPSRWRMR